MGLVLLSDISNSPSFSRLSNKVPPFVVAKKSPTFFVSVSCLSLDCVPHRSVAM